MSLHAVARMIELAHRHTLCPLQVMYQLQRGPMLGHVAGHSDERALLHTCFLAADAPVALLMMAPALYVFTRESAAFQATPALDLAIHTGQCLPLSPTCIQRHSILSKTMQNTRTPHQSHNLHEPPFKFFYSG